MNKGERKKYILAQLKSLPNAFQYVAVTDYINSLEEENQQLKEQNSILSCQLEEMKLNKTDYTEVNILEMKFAKRDEVIDEAIRFIEKWNTYFVEVYDDKDGYTYYDEPKEHTVCPKELLDILKKYKKEGN